MNDQPLVTIGMPTYNRAGGYLRQALDSALAQTYPNCEIVVSDNCSTDRTPELVRARASDRLRYFRHARNIGANENFNFCLEQARGRYFLLLHDDDRIDADFVETCMRAVANRTEVGAIRTGTRVIDDEGGVKSVKPNNCQGMTAADVFLTWFAKGTALYLCSTLFNTERLRQHGGFDSPKGLYQDVVAFANLAARYGTVDVEAPLASFRRHGENKGSSASALDWTEDSLFLLGLLCELMPDRAEELRRNGLPYLCQKCYRIARGIDSPVLRWRTYLTIYDRFERSYSPVSHSLRRNRNEARSYVGRMLRSLRQSPKGTVSN
ncbi:MAG TPA: glycosyltransferase [Trueperaceae bacterium]